MTITLLALAVLPVIILSIYVYRKDTVEKEPPRMLLKAFLYGMVSVLPAIGFEMGLSQYEPYTPLFAGLWNGYVVAGFSEELLKLLLLHAAVWKSREFNEYFDGIVYSTYVALGFACVENIGYVFMQDGLTAAVSTGAMRAVLSVPGHFLFGVVMGYYVALAKFEPWHKSACLFKALFFPMLLHGTFDALLMIPEKYADDGLQMVIAPLLFVVFIWFDVRLWKIGIRRMRRLQECSAMQGEQRAYDETSAQEHGPDGRSSLDSLDWNV